MQKFFQRGANLGYDKRGGCGSLYGVLHPTLAGGGRELHKGGGMPLPPLNTALVTVRNVHCTKLILTRKVVEVAIWEQDFFFRGSRRSDFYRKV